MGGIFSKRDSPRHSPRHSSYGSGSYSWSQENYPQPPYPYPSYDSGQSHFVPPPQSYGGVRMPESKPKLERKYSKIDDNYNSLEQVR